MKATPKGWPRLSTAIYYDDAAGAIDWLCRAFTFEVRLKVEGDGGRKFKQVGISAKFSDTPGSIRSLAPQLGQHTDEILGELGYSKDELDRWRESGAIK